MSVVLMTQLWITMNTYFQYCLKRIPLIIFGALGVVPVSVEMLRQWGELEPVDKTFVVSVLTFLATFLAAVAAWMSKKASDKANDIAKEANDALRQANSIADAALKLQAKAEQSKYAMIKHERELELMQSLCAEFYFLAGNFIKKNKVELPDETQGLGRIHGLTVQLSGMGGIVGQKVASWYEEGGFDGMRKDSWFSESIGLYVMYPDESKYEERLQVVTRNQRRLVELQEELIQGIASFSVGK